MSNHLLRSISANWPLLVLGLVALLIPFVGSDFQTLEFAYALIFAMAILGLNILTGFSGQISLGHGAFMAIGAFTHIDQVQAGIDVGGKLAPKKVHHDPPRRRWLDVSLPHRSCGVHHHHLHA